MVRKELTKEMILKGQFVKYADCTRLIEDTKTVVCNLLTESEETLETEAVFIYSGTKKDSPFTLTTAEINQLKNPTDSNNES